MKLFFLFFFCMCVFGLNCMITTQSNTKYKYKGINVPMNSRKRGLNSLYGVNRDDGSMTNTTPTMQNSNSNNSGNHESRQTETSLGSLVLALSNSNSNPMLNSDNLNMETDLLVTDHSNVNNDGLELPPHKKARLLAGPELIDQLRLNLNFFVFVLFVSLFLYH